MSSLPPEESSNWAWLWKNTHTLPRITFFLWIYYHNKLPTRLFLFNRHISPSPCCHYCNSDETILHVLRDCNPSKALWSSLGDINQIYPTFFTDQSISSWIQSNCTSTQSFQSLPSWASLFTFVCWSLWQFRNRSIFNPSDSINTNQFISIPQIFAKTYEFLFYNNRMDSSSTCITSFSVTWTCPP